MCEQGQAGTQCAPLALVRLLVQEGRMVREVARTLPERALKCQAKES